jgi:hypothetical protein
VPLALSRTGLAVVALLALSAAAAVVAATHGFSQSLAGLAAQATLVGVVFAASLLKRSSARRIGAQIILGMITAVKVLELARAALG